MDFWHDAAAQKRWLRRFALLIGLLLVPVFVLAVFARPSADDYIYAARTHAVIQRYGFDLPRLLKAAWDTNVYYYQNWQGLYVSGFTLSFQPAIFGNRFYGVTLLCVLLPLFFCLYGLARCVVLRLSAAQKRLPWALALLLTTDTATTARQLEARIKRLTRAQKDALIADPACLPDLCPALAGADIRPVPDAQLADYLPNMTNPADA